MHRMYFLTGLALLLSLPSLGTAQSAVPDAPATTIHSSSDLVVVDVTVLDSQQNPVHNLTAGDFKILEDGHLQTIKNFEEHIAPISPPTITPIPKLEEGTYTNYTPAPASGPLTILLLDTLNTPTDDQIYVRNQLLKYLKEARPGSHVAIFGLGTRLYLIRGFTTDLDLLRTTTLKTKPDTSPLLDDTVGNDATPGADKMQDEANKLAGATGIGNTPLEQARKAAAEQMATDEQVLQLQARVHYTLDGFNQLARFLGSLPGHKNLIWFSGSFPIGIAPDPSLKNPFGAAADFSDEFKDTVTRLGRSQVAVYPVDARGLRTDPCNLAGCGVTGPAQMKAHLDFNIELSYTHSTMQSMAEATGGRSLLNTNDLVGVVEKGIEAGSNYYTLTYVPANPEQNGFYRKIKVEVARKGVTLAYRHGYYSYDLRAQNHRDRSKVASTAGPEAATYNAFNAAMMRGAPEPTEIVFLASARPSTVDPEPAVAPGNKVEPKVKGPFRRYTVRYNASAANLDCPATLDGVHHCALEFAALVYDSDGTLVNSQTNAVNAALAAPSYKAAQDSGVQYRQQISVPVSGEFSLRVGILDLNSDRVGAIGFPLAEAAKLTPVSATQP